MGHRSPRTESPQRSLRRDAVAPQRPSPVPAPQRGLCACGGRCPRCAEGGQALDATLRAKMEARLNTPLADVRVHTGSAAAALAKGERARAFTLGNQIYFGDGRFAPGSAAGGRLLAHELVHVAQQRAGRQRGVAGSALGAEAEARSLSSKVAAGLAVSVSQAAPASVQRDGDGSDSSGAQLHLDPELEARMAFERWMAQQVGAGPGATAAPSSAAVAPALQPLPTAWFRPSLLGAERVDFGSLITPYYDRGLMPGAVGDTRDLGVVSQLFGERYQLVQRLPDIGPVVRPFLGSEWRLRLAETLTSTTIDFALSGDHPSVFDVSNRTWENTTGATTYSLPMVKVPLLNDWWNRATGGSGGR
jgi:hypothetical protein